MIRLGLRLAAGGSREALVRLLVTAVGVALGVGLLLASLASMNAVNSQNVRGAWLNQPQRSTVASTGALWWLAGTDEFAGKTINRIDVAATGSQAADDRVVIAEVTRQGLFEPVDLLAHHTLCHLDPAVLARRSHSDPWRAPTGRRLPADS